MCVWVCVCVCNLRDTHTHTHKVFSFDVCDKRTVASKRLHSSILGESHGQRSLADDGPWGCKSQM